MVQKSSRIRVGVPNSLNPNRNLSLLIILIVGVYMVCNLPRCVLVLYCLANRCATNNDGEDIDTKCYLIFTVIADFLNILNSCLNIVVYCFSGTKFRREVKGLLLCRWCKNSVTPLTHQSVHVSLREVPATPIDIYKSFNMSFKELQMPNNLRHPCSIPQGALQPVTLCTSCPQSFLNDSNPSPGVSSASTSRTFQYDQQDETSTHRKSSALLLKPPLPPRGCETQVVMMRTASEKTESVFLAVASSSSAPVSNISE